MNKEVPFLVVQREIENRIYVPWNIYIYIMNFIWLHYSESLCIVPPRKKSTVMQFHLYFFIRFL